MLNEAPNNNDIIHVANIVLNEVPNSNDREQCTLNCNGRTTILNGDYIAIMQKSRLTRDKR